MGDVERRVLEAHATVEKMRNDFEIEREGHAATDRELRARLNTETERYEALEAAHQALQEHVTALQAAHETLVETYASAKQLSAGLARAFEMPVPDVPPPVKNKPLNKGRSEPADRQRDDDGNSSEDSVLEDEHEHVGDERALQAGRAKAA